MKNILIISLLILLSACTRSAEDYVKKGNAILKEKGYTRASAIEAGIYYTKAIDADPKFYYAYFQRYMVESYLEKHEMALKDLERVIALKPKQLESYYYFAAGEAEYLQDYEKTLNYYTHAIQLTPNDAGIYASRAGTKDKINDYAGALKDYNTAISLNPKDGSSYYLRGTVKQELKDSSGACNDFSLAVQHGDRSAQSLVDACKH